MCVACGRKYRSQAQQKQVPAQKVSSPRAGTVAKPAPTVTAARPYLKYPRWKGRSAFVQKKEA